VRSHTLLSSCDSVTQHCSQAGSGTACSPPAPPPPSATASGMVVPVRTACGAGARCLPSCSLPHLSHTARQRLSPVAKDNRYQQSRMIDVDATLGCCTSTVESERPETTSTSLDILFIDEHHMPVINHNASSTRPGEPGARPSHDCRRKAIESRSSRPPAKDPWQLQNPFSSLKE